MTDKPTYDEALITLSKWTGRSQKEVAEDGESAGWQAAWMAQQMGRIVADGKPVTR